MTTVDTFTFLLFLLAWPVALAVLIAVDRMRGLGCGILVYQFTIALAIIHWFGALVNAVPWNEFQDPHQTFIGFEAATFGILALCLGAAVVPVAAKYVKGTGSVDPAASLRETGPERISIANLVVLVGAVCWLLSLTPVVDLPSIGSVIFVGRLFLVIGIGFKAWIAWDQGQNTRFRCWLASAMIFPVFTVMLSGFIGFGIAFLTQVLFLAAIFYKPRWRLLAGGVAAIYAGLSLWVVYAEHRNAIRSAVWGGADLEVRIEAISNMLSDIAPFSLWEPKHLEAIDSRLNQNSLVGAAIEYTPRYRNFIHGESIVAAVTALVPRVLWPDKPIFAGSGDIVAEHTGIYFPPGTSVGVGTVLELYINFGMTGIVIGFFVIGILLRLIDVRVSRYLLAKNWLPAAAWLVIGSCLNEPGGSFAGITATTAAGVVVTLFVTAFAQLRFGRRPATATPALAKPGLG